jgi:hypothetical protein
VVNSAGVRGRRSILPREVRVVSGNRTERVARRVNAKRKSAEGVVAEGFVRKRRPERLKARVGRSSRIGHAAENPARTGLSSGGSG